MTFKSFFIWWPPLWISSSLKWSITIEEAGFKSLILDKNKWKLEQNVSNSSELWLGDLQKHVKKHFFFPILISVTKHSGELHRSSRLKIGRCSLKYIHTPPLLLSLGWSSLRRLYSSILIRSSYELNEESRNVSEM